MTKTEAPIPIHHLALLQAYLYEIFGGEKKCEKDFTYTRWYLKEKFLLKDIEMVIAFFKEKGIGCDCDILKKLNLQNLSNGKLNFHN